MGVGTEGMLWGLAGFVVGFGVPVRFAGKTLREAEEKKVLLSLWQSRGLWFEGGLPWMVQEEVCRCDKCFKSTVLRC